MADQVIISSAEIAKRTRARRHLLRFIEYVDPRFAVMPPHVPFMCECIEETVKFVETGQGIPILVLETPPRHLKTTVVAELLPAWFLGRNPTMKVIDTTYAESLAYDSSKRVREMIETNEGYKNIFGERATSLVDANGQPMTPVDIRHDTRAMDRWMIDVHGGTFQAVGFGGTLTGRGGSLIVVDDPHANRKEAESQLERNNAWTFFISTLYTRLEKNGAIVIIMQRWHEDDLVGRLKRVTDHESEDYIEGFPPVRIVTLPAIAEKNDMLGRPEGKALWPGFKNEQALEQTKAVMGTYYWNSQYQQRPSAPEGNIFKRGWFKQIPKSKALYRIQFWDTADGKGDDNAYWACTTLAVTVFGILVEDVFRQKMDAAEGVGKIIERFHLFTTVDEPIACVWVEAKSSGKSCVAVINAGDSNVPVRESLVSGDKILRANSVAPVCSNGRVHLLQHSPWITAFMDELCSFPTSTYADQVDSFVGGMIRLIHGGFVRIGDALKKEQLEKEKMKAGPMTGGIKREMLFGKAGKGRRKQRSMHTAPTAPR